VPLAIEQAEKKEDGGDSTSGRANTGQASYGREFSAWKFRGQMS